MKLRSIAIGGLAALTVCVGAGAPNAATAQTAAAQTETPAQAAWRRYNASVERVRARILASEAAKDPQIRAQGLYFLQALEVMGFNTIVAPRPQYPALYVQSMYMPLELSWGMTNPDFLYRKGSIDGAHAYRIWGNRRGSFWSTLQLNRGALMSEAPGVVANIDFDDLPATPDGSFEILLSPDPPSKPDGRYWVKLDPNLHDIALTLRETFYDWTRDIPMDIHIETLDRAPGAPQFVDEARLAEQIDRQRQWLEQVVEFTMTGSVERAFGPSRATWSDRFENNTAGRSQGGNPLGYWISMIYDVGPDEALILDTPPIKARYWGYQLGTVWGQTIDFAYHQSSINGAQARPDADGHVRVVLSLEDPGVPNWLDPAGVPKGSALLRIYKADAVAVPTVTRVKLADLRRRLPADTPVVTPEQRAAALRARRTAALEWYGQ